MDIRQWNKEAWNRQAERRVPWAQPVSPESMARARSGDWQLLLTPQKAVPRNWLGSVESARVLCLAGAGGQQAPLLAAAGAVVTVLDNSPAMLALDSQVADREGLDITTVEGHMADLRFSPDAFFDLIVHPVSNCFVAQVQPVWNECYRVLKPGGKLLAGFMNPAAYIFDFQLAETEGRLEVVNKLPYADDRDLPPMGLQELLKKKEPLEFSHTLEDQLGGQLAAGFVLTGFYEDSFSPETGDTLTRFMPTMLATCAQKPGNS